MTALTRGCMLAVLAVALWAGAAAAAGYFVYVSPEHGYRLRLPEGWLFKSLASHDVADVRFERTSGPEISGSYQVFEGALTDDPHVWYDDAKRSFEEMGGSNPQVKKLAVHPLEEARLGGRKAHAFEFDTVLANGGRVTTRVTFLARKVPGRTDVHELIFIGDADAFAAARPQLEKMAQNVEFIDQSQGR